MDCIAYTVKGLEKIVRDELEQISGVVVQKTSDKAVFFDYVGDLKKLSNVRTADDIGLMLNDENLDALKKFRDVGTEFSVTFSLIKSDVDKEKIISELSKKLTHKPKGRAEIDVRVFGEGDQYSMAMRLTEEPLHKRECEAKDYPGALKTTIAAAMVRITTKGFSPKSKIVDNFCGSGTILCEAGHLGFETFGSDINPKSGRKTQDATNTDWPDKFFDGAISNLPWDKQHKIESVTTLYDLSLREYKRILKSNASICLLCHKPDLLIKLLKKHFGKVKIESIKIGYLGQMPTIVLATQE